MSSRAERLRDGSHPGAADDSLRGRRSRLPRPTPLHIAIVALLLAAVGTVLLFPGLAAVPGVVTAACARWLALGGTFELLSVLGFVVIFKLIFCRAIEWRLGSRIGLQALAASTVLPAGGVAGVPLAAWLARKRGTPMTGIAARSVSFVLLTNATSVIALAVVGLLLYGGVLDGPGSAELTLVPAALAAVVVGVTLIAGRPRQDGQPRRLRRPALIAGPAASLGEGIRQVRKLVTRPSWELLAAAAYFAFDNAVLWTAFRAFGHSPSFGVIVMAYVIGGLGNAVPLPAGLGAVEAGLIGTLVLYGVPLAPAAAAVLTYRVISLAVPLLLGALGTAGPVAPGRAPPSEPAHAARLRIGTEPALLRSHAPAPQA